MTERPNGIRPGESWSRGLEPQKRFPGLNETVRIRFENTQIRIQTSCGAELVIHRNKNVILINKTYCCNSS
jgi:hypothetical protein